MAARKKALRVDAARNREFLLGIAREVFAEKGLAVPIDEIAERAKLGIGTVYRHFPNKEALFEAIVSDQLEKFLADTEALKSEPDAGRALAQFLQSYSAAGAAKKDFLEALSRSSGSRAPSPLFRNFFDRIRESLEHFLKRAQRSGAVRADVDADQIEALLQGMTVASSRYEGPPEGRSRIWAVVLDGLRGPRAGKSPR